MDLTVNEESLPSAYIARRPVGIQMFLSWELAFLLGQPN